MVSPKGEWFYYTQLDGTFYNKCMTLSLVICIFHFSDTMGNKGAFITLTAPDLKPKFTSYDAVVSTFLYIPNHPQTRMEIKGYPLVRDK